jgi:hypothetical protein
VSPAAAPPRPGPWARFVAALSRLEPGTSFALFRIGIGSCLVLTLAEMCVRGVIPVLWLPEAYGGYQEAPRVAPLLALLGGATQTSVFVLVGAGLASGVALALGVGGPVLGRAIAFLALHAFQTCVHLNPDATGSYDGLLLNALWLLVLGNGTGTLSLHARLRHGTWTAGEPVLAFARWLAVYQLVLMYWMTGLQKISVHWTPGGDFGALYYILQQPSWNRGDMSWVAPFYPLTQLATALVWGWEISAPLLLLAVWAHATRGRPGRLRALANRMHLRALYVAMGVAFHLTTTALMNVGPFSWVALSYYFCLFEPDEWHGLVERLSARRRQRDLPDPGSSPLPATSAGGPPSPTP